MLRIPMIRILIICPLVENEKSRKGNRLGMMIHSFCVGEVVSAIPMQIFRKQ